MNRRDFFKQSLYLLTLPFLPKIESDEPIRWQEKIDESDKYPFDIESTRADLYFLHNRKLAARMKSLDWQIQQDEIRTKNITEIVDNFKSNPSNWQKEMEESMIEPMTDVEGGYFVLLPNPESNCRFEGLDHIINTARDDNV